jgi:hypothetical protein
MWGSARGEGNCWVRSRWEKEKKEKEKEKEKKENERKRTIPISKYQNQTLMGSFSKQTRQNSINSGEKCVGDNVGGGPLSIKHNTSKNTIGL